PHSLTSRFPSTPLFRSPVLSHDFVQRGDQGLSECHLLRHSSITSARVSKVQRGLRIRQRAFQRKARRLIGILTNLGIELLNFITDRKSTRLNSSHEWSS